MAKRHTYSFSKGLAKALTRTLRAAGAAAGVAGVAYLNDALANVQPSDLVNLGLPSVAAFAIVELANNYRKNRTR